ncbi:hypothetical protein [Micromonospora echinofusca]|uniref:Uncharacterized protein n=1 Tax=Micromonospora echinofusca TaxID=47858 RepID=A0ABS3VWM6_MICEH|nr:hypothetical protein [Micromonospora echinofusca]MBO4208774.1 hypothetical protein [Micromonospora echinofusca]
MIAILNATGPAPAPVPGAVPLPGAGAAPAPGAGAALPAAPAPVRAPAPVDAVDVGAPAEAAFGPVLALPGTRPAAVVPVTRQGRPVGAFLLSGDRLRYRPVVNADQVLAAAAGALTVAALVAGAVAVGRRRPPAIGALTMGPGGWVSLRGLPTSAPRAARPWWARLLRADRLVVQR